jgi:tetratricopeptide (TPR) repeat protein
MKRHIFVIILILSNINFTFGQTDYENAIKEYDIGNFDKAIPFFTKSIEKNEKIQDSYLYRSVCYLYTEKAIESKKDVDKAYDIDSSYVKNYVFYGRCFSATNQFGKALESYNIALKKTPKDYILYSERAGTKCMLGMYEEAIKDADIAVKNSPKDYVCWLNRGFVKLRMDKYNDAVEDFNKSLQIKPSQRGFGNRGTAYALLKKNDLAIQDFNKALEYNPDDLLILFYQGQVYEALGENEKACTCYLKSKLLGNNQIDNIIDKIGCKVR